MSKLRLMEVSALFKKEASDQINPCQRFVSKMGGLGMPDCEQSRERGEEGSHRGLEGMQRHSQSPTPSLGWAL